jgi:predicted DNA-binding antitoxin AbrB/MazE fold protein
MYENGIMKPFKIVFKKREEAIRKRIEGLIKVHYMHEWKYHNETPLYN